MINLIDDGTPEDLHNAITEVAILLTAAVTRRFGSDAPENPKLLEAIQVEALELMSVFVKKLREFTASTSDWGINELRQRHDDLLESFIDKGRDRIVKAALRILPQKELF